MHAEYQRGNYRVLAQIRDGDSGSSPAIISLCEGKLPIRVRSFYNALWIQFNTDWSDTSTGFNVSYTAEKLRDKFLLLTASRVKRIIRMGLDVPSNIVVPLDGVDNPVAVDFDPVQDRIYWADTGLKEIRSAFLNGSDSKVVVTLSAKSVAEWVAVDPVSRLVFYSDAGNDVIVMLRMSSWEQKTVVSSGLSKPRSIVLDTADGLLFWTDLDQEAKIERANYDGSERQTLVTEDLLYPNSLALDKANDRLYYVDAGTNLIAWTNLAGTQRKTISVSFIAHFFGVTLYKDYLYVTDWGFAGC
ncbi:hypothetical protein BaRGS_00026282 [Batillaria attramentaria]|uniref:CUB domain-containing protein n=1 Tax=Batillaria attramentaria TaxID=370345 RepID=A0ABD0K4Y0_9CAEN